MDSAQENAPAGARSVRLVVAYNGTRYHGWQRQADGVSTVQQCIEAAAGRVLGHPVSVAGAGRTDAGVHALGQVANLRTTNLSIPLANFRRALNSKLPDDIAALSAAQAGEDFHASRSAIGKTYRYRIHRGPAKPVMFADQVWHCRAALDLERMGAAARRVVGRHDFRGFAYAAESRENTVRIVTRCEVAECGDEVRIFVAGDGFLYKMVRNIVGTLVEIARGRWGPEQIDVIVSTRDRGYAGPTALPGGLCLMSVDYPLPAAGGAPRESVPRSQC